jgi:hypothetical protein
MTRAPWPSSARLRALSVISALLAAPALAYETDQLTDRAQPLADQAWIANLAMDTVLAQAAVATNEALGCGADEERTRRVLARHIYHLTSRNELVEERSGLRKMGYGRYDAWLEGDVGDQRDFDDRSDIFGGVHLHSSVILNRVGTCGTLRIGDTLLGIDKLTHFLDLGYGYYHRSRWGAHPERALAWGTRTERTWLGKMSSKTFSYADLAANWEGYLFYRDLLTPGSPLQRDDEGCVVRSAPFRWQDWVDWEYDEVLNPSVHTRQVQQDVTAHLESHREQICADYARWGGPWYSEHLAALDPDPPYVSGHHPPRTDPYHLDALCAVR